MEFSIIDTHVHLYDDIFDIDIDHIIKNAIDYGVNKFYIPSIDSKNLEKMLLLESIYPNFCKLMIGVHPLSISKYNLKNELNIVKSYLKKRPFSAIGEIGIDLFYNKYNTLNEQIEAFNFQIKLAKKKSLPIVIHSRSSFNYIFKILEKNYNNKISGIFHCFSGSIEEAKTIIDYGMKLGIGGIITFKNNKIANYLDKINIKNIVIETDAPYLSPEPYRGKRNHPNNLKFILAKLSKIYSISQKEIAKITTKNAIDVFVNY